MKPVKNDTTRAPGIKLAIDWLKGMRMHIPYSKWVMFTLGVYVLACALDRVSAAIGSLIPLFR